MVDEQRGEGWQRPDSEHYWSTRLDTLEPDRLQELHAGRLVAAVRYTYACIPFYRRKFDAIGLEPGDIRSLEDLSSLPVTTKQEMAEDQASAPPWGGYTAVDDWRWQQSGWQIFATSGTAGQPRVFRYTNFDRSIWSWANARAMWSTGFRPDRDSVMLAFGYGRTYGYGACTTL